MGLHITADPAEQKGAIVMAKGSVRKKGKKYYYRFYVEDESGKMVQREYAGTESKSESTSYVYVALVPTISTVRVLIFCAGLIRNKSRKTHAPIVITEKASIMKLPPRGRDIMEAIFHMGKESNQHLREFLEKGLILLCGNCGIMAQTN